MKTLIPMVTWFFTQSIYGMAALAAILYGLMWVVRKVFPRLPAYLPFAVAATVFVR